MGLGFFNEECNTLFSFLRIIHEFSHGTQQNGVVERKQQHILQASKALKFQGSILVRFLVKCVIVDLYLINKKPTDVLKGQSPYQLFHKARPKFSNLRIIGYFCYVIKLIKDACIMTEYSSTEKRYALHNLSLKKFVVSWDVTFKKHIFPFGSWQ